MLIEPSAIGLAYHARTVPEKPAITMGDRTLTYGALNARVNRLANALRRAGVDRGDAVAAVLENGCEWFELLNAAGKLGAQLVPVGYRLKAPEIAFMATDSGAKVIIGAPALRGEIDRALSELDLPDEHLWVTGAEPPWRGRGYETVLAQADAAEPEGAFVGGFNVLIYTSGTTGRPKGIERAVDPSQAHLSMLGMAELWQIGPHDVHLVVGPLYHTGPASYGQLQLLVGGTVVLMPHFDAAEALALIARHRVTNTFMVPTHFNPSSSSTLRRAAATICRRCVWSCTPPRRVRRT